jgi:prepilin-type N-terminal cleavage/methylation domain-containing protein
MPRLLRKSQGFSLVELLIVMAIMFIVAAMAIINIRGALPGMRANAVMQQAVSQFRTAREQALGQRRNFQITFPGGANTIQLTRLNVQAVTVGGVTTISQTGSTVVNTIQLESNFQFVRFAGVPDTPDGFSSGSSAIDFGGSPIAMFLSDGTMVDASGNPLNGTVFMGLPGQSNTARAVSIMGATGRIRGYRWTGGRWIE